MKNEFPKQPTWAIIKRFKFINDTLSIENYIFTQTLKLKRKKVNDFFVAEIDSLYQRLKNLQEQTA